MGTPYCPHARRRKWGHLSLFAWAAFRGARRPRACHHSLLSLAAAPSTGAGSESHHSGSDRSGSIIESVFRNSLEPFMEVKGTRKRGAGGVLVTASISRTGGGTMQQQLYSRVRDLILSGELSGGVRMPSSRVLAEELGIARNTVAAAFEQLQSEGYLVSKVGSGTRVSDRLPDELMKAYGRPADVPAQPPDNLGISDRAAQLMAIEGVVVSWLPAFSPGLPAIDEFPYAAWSKLVAQEWQRAGIGSMNNDAGGYWPLRSQIAEYVSSARGVQADADQVIIVTGNREGTELVGQVLLNPGDAAIVEEPGYAGTKSALSVSGIRLLTSPVDEHGMDISRATDAHRAARLLCIAPSHQYPLGFTTSLERRLEILNWCKQNSCWILEDDYDSEFRYRGRPLPALASLDPSADIIYVGTFSKTLLPSIRIGYLIVPKRLIQAFVRTKLAMSGPTTIISQRAISSFIESGMFYRHLRVMRRIYAERRSALEKALRKHLPCLVIPPQEEAGLFMVTLFAENTFTLSDVAIAAEAKAIGIYVVPLSLHYLEAQRKSGLIFGYGALKPEEIEEPVVRLARAMTQWKHAQRT